MLDLQDLIRHHRDLVYLVTFLWTALEGESFVIIAGFAASKGVLSAPLLVACAWAGSFLGDQFYFFLGRRYGTRLLERYPHRRGPVDRVLRLLDKYDTLFVLSFRFIYGVRNVSSFALGMSHISWRKFIILNLIAAGIWAVSFVAIGYYFGRSAEAFFGGWADYFGIGVLVLILVGVGLALRPGKRPETPGPKADPQSRATVDQDPAVPS